jgi:hypothetical protein
LYGQALERVTQILRPPIPLPIYPIPKPMSLEDVRHALQLICKDALTWRMAG